MRACLSIAAGVALCCVLSACGGGGEPPQDPPVAAQRVMFPAPATKTVFSGGAISFQVSPARSGSERVVCALDNVEVESCLIDDQHGQIEFSGLSAGPHAVSVRIIPGGSHAEMRADHALRIEPVQLVVFGATPGGITAALAASQSGLSVAILEPTHWVGGMMSAGLAKSDVGPRGHEILGGLAAEFLRRVQATQRSAGACPDGCEGFYDIEPHVAEQEFEAMLAEEDVIVERDVELLSVFKEGAIIRSLATSRGDVAAQVFIDGSYEGDLMARAGIEYAVGREPRVIAAAGDANALALQEDHAGVRRYRLPFSTLHVDPFIVPGDPASGTIAFIEPRPASMPKEGDADSLVMAYNYRLCVTDDPSNRIAFSAPVNYDPARYEASARVAQALAQSGIDLETAMFNPARTVLSKSRAHYKYDLNGGSTFSTDMTAPMLNQAYVEATDEERESIRRAYHAYIRGLLYFWQTDARFQGLNRKIARFGYCADEFVDRDHWPHQLYVRVARRMRGEYVMHEADVLQNGRRAPVSDPVGFGAYDIDMHTHRYFAGPVDWPGGTRREAIVIEGFHIVPLPGDRPYPISYRALVPQARDASNLLNPVTLSATHVAYSSLRMEPTAMILGEAAGVAASIAVERGSAVQAVPYEELRSRLLVRGQRLSN